MWCKLALSVCLILKIKDFTDTKMPVNEVREIIFKIMLHYEMWCFLSKFFYEDLDRGKLDDNELIL